MLLSSPALLTPSSSVDPAPLMSGASDAVIVGELVGLRGAPSGATILTSPLVSDAGAPPSIAPAACC